MKKMKYEEVVGALRDIGLKTGDIVFVTGDLLKVGFFPGSKSATYTKWLEVFAEVLGPHGTIVAASYTETSHLFSKHKVTYGIDSPTTSGALSKILLSSANCVRSRHPTNSYVAIGPHARAILDPHDEDALSYDPIGRVIELGGKNLMLGTVDHQNAPMALHYVQEIEGYTKRHPLSGVGVVHYTDLDGRLRRFVRWDVGGCSSGGINLYGHLLTLPGTVAGRIGGAVSVLMDGKESFESIKEILGAKGS